MTGRAGDGCQPAAGTPNSAAFARCAAVAALDPAHWEISVAEERLRRLAGTGVDAVLRAITWQGIPTTTASLQRGFNY